MPRSRSMSEEMLRTPVIEVMKAMHKYDDTSDDTLLMEYTYAIQNISKVNNLKEVSELRIEILRRMYE